MSDVRRIWHPAEISITDRGDSSSSSEARSAAVRDAVLAGIKAAIARHDLTGQDGDEAVSPPDADQASAASTFSTASPM